MNNRLTFAAATLALGLAATAPAFGADEFNVTNGITSAGVPLGLHGVDAVALTRHHDVAEGSARHQPVCEIASWSRSEVTSRPSVGTIQMMTSRRVARCVAIPRPDF